MRLTFEEWLKTQEIPDLEYYLEHYPGASYGTPAELWPKYQVYLLNNPVREYGEGKQDGSGCGLSTDPEVLEIFQEWLKE